MNLIQTPLVVMIPYAEELHSRASLAAEAWKYFCALPSAHKEPFSIGIKDPTCDFGYRLREEGDPKEFFHVRRDILPSLLKLSEKNTVAHDFLVIAGALLGDMQDLALAYLAELERINPATAGYRAELFDHGFLPTLRFLHYLPGHDKGSMLASPHLDQGGVTMHLYESDKGLEYFDLSREWKSIDLSTGATACFSGIAAQHATKGIVTACCHRVKADERSARVGRWSLVCFTELTGVQKILRQLKLSQFDPGFNYGMPATSLAKLFG